MSMAMPFGPGGPMEVVFSFDTTGSMGGCLNEVRTNVAQAIERLFKDLPALRIAVFAHGDYCDSNVYVTKYVDFTTNVKTLCDFVKTVQTTHGGDAPEAYERVLKQAREELSWTPGTQRSLVMIGDSEPHEPDYPMNTDNTDWRVETKRLYRDLGVKIYAVECNATLSDDSTRQFYQTLAKETQGKRLTLEQFPSIVEMLMAICYRERGAEFFEAYEKEVRTREGPGMKADLDRMFDTLRGTEADSTTGSSGVPSPVATVAKRSKKAHPACAARKGTKRSSADAGDGAKTLKKAKVTMKSKRVVPAKKTARVASSKLVRKAKKAVDTSIKVSALERKKRREDTPHKDFSLNTIKWSKWHPCMQPTAPDVGDSDSWIPRRQEHFGVRNIGLFNNDTTDPAMYEFAVQTAPGCKRYPMYARFTSGFRTDVNWDTYLLRHTNVVTQVDRVLRKGCKLYVRRAPASFAHPVKTSEGESLSNIDEMRTFISGKYDYAWNKCHFGKRRHRRVDKSGVLISNSRI